MGLSTLAEGKERAIGAPIILSQGGREIEVE